MEHKKQQSENLLITNVCAFGPYLKICGQLNPMIDLPQRLKEVLLPSCGAMNNGWSIEKKRLYLDVGRIYLVRTINRVTKLGESELLRARIIRLIETHPPPIILLVEVDFIDMGYTKIVECEELLIAPDHELIRMPALGSNFILFGVFAELTSLQMENILRLIARNTLCINVEMEIKGYKFIKMKWKGWDFSELLITQEKIGCPINKNYQRENFLGILKKLDNKKFSHNNDKNNNTRKQNKNIHQKTNQNIENKPNANNLKSVGGRIITSRLDEAKTIIQNFKKEQQKDFLRQQLLQREKQTVYMPGRIVPNIHDQNRQGLLQSQTSPFTSLTKSVKNPPYSYNVVNSITPLENLPSTDYKITKFSAGRTYNVFVTFVDNGPYLFSVQLVSAQHELAKMTKQMERIRLQSLSGILKIGAPCIALSSKDGHLYRALIINVQGNEVKVVYVDYGYFEQAVKSDLYEIPAQLMDQCACALPFALDGLKLLEPIDYNLKKAFKEMVLYKECKMKTVKSERSSIVQYCELYVQNKNILHLLQKSRLIYAKASPLTNDDIVEIRFIDTPCSFFVQKVVNINEFDDLMDDMFRYYNSYQVVPEHIALGAAYVVKTDTDWYRAEVIHVNKDAVTVRHVDFGYERTVTKNLLSKIAEKHLKMPRQAVHCCLKGFENNELNKELLTIQFEMLAEDSDGQSRRSFNVKVLSIESDNLHIVNLFTKQLNVMETLYKLSMPLEQYLLLKKDDFYMNESYEKPKLKTREDEQNTKTSSANLSNFGASKSNEELAGNFDEETSSINVNNTIDIHSSTDDNLKCNSYQPQKGNLRYKMEYQQQRSRSFESKDLRRDISNDNNISRPIQISLDDFNLSHQKKNNVNTKSSSCSPKQKQQEYSQNTWIDCSQYRVGSISSEYGENDVYPTPLKLKIKIEYTTLDYDFPQDELPIPIVEDVTICWWTSAHQFFLHRKSRETAFTNFMRDIQNFYRNKPLLQLPLKAGSYIIARHREDKMFFRARIISCNPMQRKYNVYFVDFGTEYSVTIDDIWPVECRFADFPIMGNYCSLSNIVSNYDHLYIIERMDKYLPKGAKITCNYKERKDNLYYVNLWVNGVSLLERLTFDGLVKEISTDICINLLAGQQIRAKIVSVKTILNFKILIEGCDVPLLSSIDDMRMLETNADIDFKFKNFYENKYWTLNIKEVNDNNVILLRPVFPLFKQEPVIHICHYPRIVNTFEADVVHISSPHRIFVHQHSIIDKIDQLLDDMYYYYENGGSPICFDVGELCAAKSKVYNTWYRACIIDLTDGTKTKNSVEVYYIDYGNTEQLERTQLKKLEKRFYEEQSAYATEINLPLRLTSSKRLKEKSETVLQELKHYLDDNAITVNIIGCRRNHLMGEIILDKGENMVDILIKKNLIKGRDINYMGKLLDKDKSGIFEFIETVDLTLDDEDVYEDKEDNEQTKSQTLTILSNKLNTSRERFEHNGSSKAQYQTPTQQLLDHPDYIDSSSLSILYRDIDETIKELQSSNSGMDSTF